MPWTPGGSSLKSRMYFEGKKRKKKMTTIEPKTLHVALSDVHRTDLEASYSE